MSITSYAELQAAIGNWLDHSLFTARIPEFIALFEACANRRLRVRQQETTTNLTPDANGNATLPADYLALRRVTWTGSPRVELQYVHPSYLQAAYPSAPADVPRIFTIEGSTLRVRPLDQTALEISYFQKIPALATTDPNWLLTAHPDLYLFGSMVEAEAFGVNDERAPLWKARRDGLRRDRQAQQQDARWRSRRRARDGNNAMMNALVMAGHSASEDARERAYDPAIHRLRKTSSEE